MLAIRCIRSSYAIHEQIALIEAHLRAPLVGPDIHDDVRVEKVDSPSLGTEAATFAEFPGCVHYSLRGESVLSRTAAVHVTAPANQRALCRV